MYDKLKEIIKYKFKFQLGPIIVSLYSNVFIDCSPFFVDLNKDISQEKSEWKIYFIKCSNNSELYLESLNYKNNLVRSKYFKKGYYVCDHFGLPLNLFIENHSIVIFGESFNRVFWSFIIKYIMQIWAIENKALFIKCASFEYNNQATIVIGPGNSGKTVFNSFMCKEGCKFITNSNALIKDQKIKGICSKVRLHSSLINDFNFCIEENILDKNEFTINPSKEFLCSFNSWTPIKNFLIINYEKNGDSLLKISSNDSFLYSEEFLLGLNVYRLEEDILDYFKKDTLKFIEFLKFNNYQLKLNIDSCENFYFKGNIFEVGIDNILKLLY